MAKFYQSKKDIKESMKQSTSGSFLRNVVKAVYAIYEDGVIKDDTSVAAKRIKEYMQQHGGTSHSRKDITIILSSLVNKHQIKQIIGKDDKGHNVNNSSKNGGIVNIKEADGTIHRVMLEEPLKQVSGVVKYDSKEGYFLQPINPKYKTYKIRLYDVPKAKKHLGQIVGAKILSGDNEHYDAQIDKVIQYQPIMGVLKQDVNGELYLHTVKDEFKNRNIKVINYGKANENVDNFISVRVIDVDGDTVVTTIDRVLDNKLIPGIVRVKENGNFYLETLTPNLNGKQIELLKDEETRARLGKLVGAKLINGESSTIAVVEKSLDGNEFNTELISRIFAEIYDLGISTMPEPEQLKRISDELKSLPTVIDEDEIAYMKSKYPNFIDETHIPFVCIDPIGCKERDDAVFVKKLTAEDSVEPELIGGYLEEIAISLVGEFMDRLGKDSETFKYISQVCTNTYVADMVFTMFLKEFNEGMGSLNANENRLAMVTKIYRDDNFAPIKTEICPAVVRIKAVLAYEEQDYINEYKDYLTSSNAKISKLVEYQTNISNIFNRFNLNENEVGGILKSTDALRELNKGLRPIREHNGTMDFKTIELNYRLNSDRNGVESVHSDNATEAHKMIETPMLSANMAMAEYARDNDLPFIYRVEPRIDESSVEHIQMFLDFLGIPFYAGEDCSYSELNKEINNAVYLAYKKHGKKFAHVVSSKIICALPKAEYSTEADLGHSALNFNCYSHTTSPDRRAADTLAQMQILKFWETGKICFTTEELDDFCRQANICERNADQAERNSDKILNVFYVGQLINEGDEKLRQNGCIARVDREQIEVITDYGYVTVRFSYFDCNSPFKIDSNCLQIKHKSNSDLVYKVGQSIMVEATKASIEDKTVYGDIVRTKKTPENVFDEIDKNM